MSRDEIETLAVGDLVSSTLDTRGGVPRPDAEWTPPRRVEEIYARGETAKGRAFVCFYTQFGLGRISCSVTEGEVRVRVVRPGRPEDER